MMSPALPPVPSSGATPFNPADAGPIPVNLPQEPSQTDDAMNTARNIMRQLMDERRANESMASQYPAAANDLRNANEALKQAMLKIVTELQQTPGSNPAPPVGPG